MLLRLTNRYRYTRLLAVGPLLVLTACAGLESKPPGSGHLGTAPSTAERKPAPGTIPAPVATTVTLPRPKATAKTETYSVSVRSIPIEELLFALARDAKLNVDIHPGISGKITINAIDQTLQQILQRIAKQADVRWEIDGPNLVVMPDSPFLRNYRIDYVNLTRDASIKTEVSAQVGSSGGSSGTSGASTGSGGGSAKTTIETTAKNNFWDRLGQNIKDLLQETDKTEYDVKCDEASSQSGAASTQGSGTVQASGQVQTGIVSSAMAVLTGSGNTERQTQVDSSRSRSCGKWKEKASVIPNPESGVISVRATARQHEKVQEFIDQIMSSARRQVLIEATIAEVNLSQSYQQGIDWQRLRRDGTGFSLTQAAPGVLAPVNAGGPTLSAATQVPAGTIGAAGTGSVFVLGYRNSGQNLVNFAAAVKLLESFGNVKVLSSPKLSVLNNQTAMLKIVNNIVYFNVKSDATTSSTGVQTTTTTTPQSVSVGLVMTVTPQISESNSVVLNVRPMISRVTNFKADPNPAIPAGLSNLVPEIETREMESVLRVTNGDIAILGGLMQDSVNLREDGVPGLSRLPGVGGLFSYKNDANTKTELVIFLRPIVVRDPSLQGDFQEYAAVLPDEKFLDRSWRPKPLEDAEATE